VHQASHPIADALRRKGEVGLQVVCAERQDLAREWQCDGRDGKDAGAWGETDHDVNWLVGMEHRGQAGTAVAGVGGCTTRSCEARR
jgi:hypothetical protein